MVGHYKRGVERFGDEIREQLALFGHDGDGSLYGLWFNKKRPSAQAPVVYLNSEGSDDTEVITANLTDFVSLLLLDRDEVGMFYDVARNNDDRESKYHDAFVKWAKYPPDKSRPEEINRLALHFVIGRAHV